MSINNYPMTAKGAKTLQTELAHLKQVERPNIIAAIAEARAHGDLRENAEYHAAKERQGFIEGRICDLENKLGHAQIIDVTKIKNEGRVVFGATVTVIKLEDECDKDITYQIVGDDESDLKQNKIAIHSPIARALIGKRVDDVVEVNTPNGIVEYEIIKVEYL
jgi:transcription elongation factor GreA